MDFSLFVYYTFIFLLGAILGWIIEVFYRHFASKKGEWVNPGFCVGPWLPIYGFGLLVIFIIVLIGNIIFVDETTTSKIVLFIFISICMTILELIAGIVMLKIFKMRLWDYRNEFLNFKGYICLKFSIFWALLGAIYYFLLHQYVSNAVKWFSDHLMFSFVVGFAFAIFLVDVIYSGCIVNKVKQLAKDKGIEVFLEDLKDDIRRKKQISDAKIAFFLFMNKEDLINASK